MQIVVYNWKSLYKDTTVELALFKQLLFVSILHTLHLEGVSLYNSNSLPSIFRTNISTILCLCISKYCKTVLYKLKYSRNIFFKTFWIRHLCFAKSLGHNTFSASNGWLDKFKNRNNIAFRIFVVIVLVLIKTWMEEKDVNVD